MRLFLSYARVDKPFCVQIAEMLDIHEIWYDQRLYAGQQWWKEILRRLDWCEGFVYLMSPESLQSEYCIKEYKIALSTGKPIFPVLIHPDARVPERLAHIQYADLSRGLTTEGIKMILNSITLEERRIHQLVAKPVGAVPEAQTAPAEPQIVSDPAAVIGKAAEAMEQGKYDRAVYLLQQAKEMGYVSRFINLNGLLSDAERALEVQTKTRVVERDYQSIVELVKRGRTRKFGCEAFAAFRKDVPDYDPENLAQLCASETQEMQAVRIVPAVLPRQTSLQLPMLEWITIPEGMLLITEASQNNSANKPLRAAQHTMHVNTFRIAKYPVTNQQYQYFLDDPDGYANPRWWGYSTFAQAWHTANPIPSQGQYKGDERPRENVTWFEAMAYCYWLSSKLDLPITLPTKQQWRRAAQGDDGRIYPWGNEFDPSVCNTRESRKRMTTLVMLFSEGQSPFGVYDMSGNVWEWCLNSAWDDLDITTDRPRAVQGGSYIGAQERAQINFSFDLSPDYHYGSIGFRLACLT
jgi:formylglycine-generating enzyme required for sulfatase activity